MLKTSIIGKIVMFEFWVKAWYLGVTFHVSEWEIRFEKSDDGYVSFHFGPVILMRLGNNEKDF